MNGNTETSSNSIKFAPMPMSALMAFLPVQRQADSADCSFTSGDESDNSFGETVAKNPIKVSKTQSKSNKTTDSEFLNPNVKSQPKTVTSFASEKKTKHNDHDKENCSESWISNQTYPNKDSHVQRAQKNVNTIFPISEKKERNALMPHNTNGRSQYSVHKNTLEIAKASSSAQKSKTATPVIKSGIRMFTPGSARKSQKKTPQKTLIPNNRDKVRCELFTQNQQKDMSNQPQNSQPKSELVHVPLPETPMNRKPMPASYAATPSYPATPSCPATPSYPQGVKWNNSKMFKITKIKNQHYMHIKKLGIGGSSEVFKVLQMGTSCEYAVKCVCLNTTQELINGYLNEVQLLRDLQNSDRVIKLFDYEYDAAKKCLRMLLEVGETDLSSFLKARGAGLPPALLLHIWDEMLQAVHYIHEHGVIHADLKPANFILVSGQLKLIDFGIASAISSDVTSVVRSQAAGTYSYISPEALMGGAGGGPATDGNAPIKISFRSDVWSLGCILYSMMYGRTPFAHLPSLAKLAAIVNPNHRIDYPPVKHLPPQLMVALKGCLKYVARERPSVRELLSLPYLQAARAPVPPALQEKARKLFTPEEYRLLQLG